MYDIRQELHDLVNDLPEHSLERAKNALLYCADPGQQMMNIEKAKQRALENSRRHLQKHAERMGGGFISGVGSGSGSTRIDGTHHSSMVAFEDGKDATVHFYIYQGTPFEVIETLEVSGDRLIRSERIKGIDGKEHLVTVELPVSR